ncbi:hypothetical protein [Serinibacter arcticus]|uniref:Uncharacterized protein n=1 Tax=Serinibacter arcticus TaxID=1655435 RepID=A0A4Z1E0H3_9MICO|nr:hypothetical protein [Serinibacter arcticus]TGO05455.1 hypothetical protein SERN_1459 [Serinibacter arcticus]
MTRVATSAAELAELDESGLALCWEGLPEGEEASFLGALAGMLEKPELREAEVVIVPGALMNATYGLTGENAYPDGLRIATVTVPQDVRALVPVLSPRGLRFFDNLVTNNAREQHRLDGGGAPA